MILIITNDGDYHADIVIDWLKYYNYKYYRLNSDIIHRVYINSEKDESGFIYDGKKISFKEIKTVWFRKYGKQNLSYSLLDSDEDLTNALNEEIDDWQKTIIQILLLQKVKWLTNPIKSYNINKVEVCLKAKEFNINIPNTYLNSNLNLTEFDKNKNYIIKPFRRPHFIKFENKDMYFLTTQFIDTSKINEKISIPSIVQEEIKRKYEIRVVYIDGDFFCTKMNEKNVEKNIDARYSLFSKDLRYEVIELKNNYKFKLKKLLKYYELNFCSIDLIVDTSDNIYFLEINPVGQFFNYSYANNFYIEKKVAESLIKLCK